MPTGDAASAKRDGDDLRSRLRLQPHGHRPGRARRSASASCPALSAITDANGDYELEVPDDTNVTPYIEPPPGYHQIDLQTFHTRGEPIENANFQTPGDAEYNGLAALLQVPFGPDGRPEQCAIVTTASARNVRGVDFETFHARTPHGVAGATAHAKPALPEPIYFNENVIPDRSQTGDLGRRRDHLDRGAGRRLSGDHEEPLDSFASFLATCEPGRIVNANPPWGAYELTPGERPLGAGVAVGSIEKVKAVRDGRRRLVAVRIDAAESLPAARHAAPERRAGRPAPQRQGGRGQRPHPPADRGRCAEG